MISYIKSRNLIRLEKTKTFEGANLSTFNGFFFMANSKHLT